MKEKEGRLLRRKVDIKKRWRVIISRIREGVDQKVRAEPAEYRSGSGTIEQIIVLRNIILSSGSLSWNSCLYLCFVDF